MTHVYVTTVFDANGKNVTGNFNNEDFIVRSTTNDPNQYIGIKNPTLSFKEKHNLPLVGLRQNTKKSVFSAPEEVFSWLYYKSYGTYTIDEVAPRTKGGKRNYLAPQGIVVDEDNGDIYISFNLGDVATEIANGGPQRVKLAGVENEYINLMPIIKFNFLGEAQGIEYVVGGTHEGYMTLWKDEFGKKHLGVAAYPHGIGTRNNDKKPDGFDENWSNYYYIGDDKVTYYSFNIEDKFTSLNRNGNQLIHSSEYGGNGIVMTKKFDSADLKTLQNSEIHVDPYRKIVQSAASVKPNIFRFDPLKNVQGFEPLNYLNFQSGRQGSKNTYQSSCIRGGHFYTSYGSKTSTVGNAEVRVSLITQGNNIEDNQSLIDTRVFSDSEISDFYETEGCWVNEKETALYFIVKFYNSSDNQQSTLRVFKTKLVW